MEAYIYALRERDADKPFYIGSTLNPDKRLADHLAAVQNGTNANRHFCNKVRKVGFDRVVMDVVEIVFRPKRWNAEVEWIQRLVGQGVTLTNRYHNGFQYVEERKREEYAEEHPFTPAKWHWAKSLRESGYQPVSAIDATLWAFICHVMDLMETKYPEGLSELLARGANQ